MTLTVSKSKDQIFCRMFPGFGLSNGFLWVLRRIPGRLVVLLSWFTISAWLIFVSLDQSLIGRGELLGYLFIRKLFFPLYLWNMVRKSSSLSGRIAYTIWKTRGPKVAFWLFCEGIPKSLWFSSRILFTLDREIIATRLHGGLVKRRESLLEYICTYRAGDRIRT